MKETSSSIQAQVKSIFLPYWSLTTFCILCYFLSNRIWQQIQISETRSMFLMGMKIEILIPSAICAWVLPGIAPSLRAQVQPIKFTFQPTFLCKLQFILLHLLTLTGVLEPEELFTALNSRNYDDVVNILGNEEHLLLSSQSLEPDTNNKAENYNYRKSLAWDNGFFTSEGMLKTVLIKFYLA